jgi:plastocyanin
MRKTAPGSLLLLACAVTAWSCSGSATPSSPSAITPLTAPGAGGARLRTLDDPPVPPTPDPANPTPDPANPPPDPNAPPAPPTPMQVIINIIGSVGNIAFMPNPIQANVGDMIVWMNTDTRLHHIVLDDGITDLGDVAPGQSSAPMALVTPTATFHCTIHPTMVGSINMELAPDPYMPPPPDDYYGYY